MALLLFGLVQVELHYNYINSIGNSDEVYRNSLRYAHPLRHSVMLDVYGFEFRRWLRASCGAVLGADDADIVCMVAASCQLPVAGYFCWLRLLAVVAPARAGR